jgi:hypothetical protein
VSGRKGELLDALLDVVNESPTGDEAWWYDLSVVIAAQVGACGGVVPDLGRDPVPGSVEEARRATARIVSKAEWMALLRARLDDLVESGVVEVFLVRALRDEIDRFVTSLADVGQGDETRRQMRDRMTVLADDPEFLARHRSGLRASGMAEADLSDEELAQKFREAAANPMLDPVDADGATQRWVTRDGWRRLRDEHLAEEVLERWAALWTG